MIQLEDIAKNPTCQYMEINDTVFLLLYGHGPPGGGGWLNADTCGQGGGSQKLAKSCGHLLWMAPIVFMSRRSFNFL